MENRSNEFPRLVFSRPEAAEALRVSVPKLDALLNRAENPLPAIRSGRRVLIPADGLRQWLAAEVERSGNAAG